ncbi:DNA-binding GntR family transcriptional regulator [Saccharothrix ecbatanensis]|uniref:DNA-binding GntR family transcriptional regulator n=1 Tax=Saccharothrix ecbatanensis TaxID=1105145 RepID=A0A7W9HJT5_9PSEU|nr:GntR family transcriptional regulator [Saccharothrix ecbatanensis]MBB5803386.1 DNA-binding GntR family transcriptional regulator [Saccharothrix ecbatanensis]
MSAADDFAHPPLSRHLLSEGAYEIVRKSILDGTFPPGHQLVESQLARKLNVSQAPMREALRRLNHEGLVTVIPYKGSYVTEVSESEAAQAREVRNALEELAARTVTGNLGDEYVQRLTAEVEGMRKAATVNDIAAFRLHDTAFHRTVIEASGNAYLIRMWTQIEPILTALGVVSDPRWTGDRSVMAEVHGNLVTLLTGNDPEAAGMKFREHGRNLAH